MTQTMIPAVFMRGGTSKGVFFVASDLPAARADMARLFLAVLGSPDPYGRQLDGMGGGISSLSKAVVISRSTHPEADVDYTFAQVSVDRPEVEWSVNCGNLSSAVGPFAVDQGLVRVEPEGEALVRIHQVNTRKIIHARFPVHAGKAEVTGDFSIDGVAGTGARIRLDFLDPGGTRGGGLLPSGAAADTIQIDGERAIRATLIDAASPAMFVAATDLGLIGTEAPDQIEARPDIMARLDRLRRAGGVRMRIADHPEDVPLAAPRIAVVARPAAFATLDSRTLPLSSHEISVRMISMERVHRAVPMTGALALGVACRLPGTVPHDLCDTPVDAEVVHLGHPSGTVAVGANVVPHGVDGWYARSAVIYRTARLLMQGAVAVPSALYAPGTGGKRLAITELSSAS